MVSRTVLPSCADTIAVWMRPGLPVAAMACSALIRMLRSACCSSSGSPETRGASLVLARHVDRVPAQRGARLASARASTRSTRSRCRDIRCEPGEDQQIPDDFRRAVAFLIDPAQRRTHRLGRIRRFNEQFEMSEHPLQRIVHLVGDSGDELAERRELLRLRQTSAQRLALGLQLHLRRDVARHEHAAARLAFMIDRGASRSRRKSRRGVRR